MSTLQSPSTAEIRLQNLTRLMHEKFNGRQSVLSRAISRKPDYIWRVMNRQKGFGEALARDIENLLNLPSGWLDDTANSTSTGKIPAAGSQIVVIPRHPEAGEPNAPKEEEGMPIRLSALQGAEIQDVIMVVQADPSMSLSIPQGEQVLINTQSTVAQDGKLVYVEHGRIRKIRRVTQESNGMWSLRCDTHDKMRYPDAQVSESELVIIGQVFWSSGRR